MGSLIKLTLLGRNDIDLEDPEYKNFSGVRLSKIISDSNYFGLQVEVDGLRPVLEGDAGSDTFGMGDVAVANRSFNFTTMPFYNKLQEDMLREMDLQRWLTFPYKFFTLWEDDEVITHNTWLAKLIINPPLGVDNLTDFDTITANQILVVPVKVLSLGSLEHTFGKGANRRYTIEMKSVRSFSNKELYSMEG